MVDYRPGVCNIGPGEQRRRKLMGGAAALAGVGVVAAVVVLDLPAWALLLVVFPAYGAAMGLLQARARFCVGFAAMGVYDAGDGRADVPDEEALARDRERARELNVRAVGVAAVVTLLAFGAGTAFL